MSQKYDVIILGAGAAGLICAIEAGKRSRRVLVVERADRIGKKILISGGGRCNFTNLHTSPDNFISANPHFAKSALARYTPADFIRLIEKHHISYHEKKLGQLFCDRAANEITSMLEQECRAAGVEIRCNTKVNAVEKNDQFTDAAEDASFAAPRLVVATGGSIHSENRRHFIRLRSGSAIRTEDSSPHVPASSRSSSANRIAIAGAIWQESQPK